jgi:hypothetical protein
MPTGTTLKLQDGEQSFEDFVLGAADFFKPANTKGIHAREQLAKNIEERDKVRSEIARLKAMNDEQLRAELVTRRESENEIWRAERVRRAELKKRYEAMIAKIEAWMPPSEKFEAFKLFMLRKLHHSLDFDCDTKFLDQKSRNLDSPIQADAWRRRELVMLEMSVKSYNQTVERDSEAFAFLDELNGILSANEK